MFRKLVATALPASIFGVVLLISLYGVAINNIVPKQLAEPLDTLGEQVELRQ